jgi:hypothetical protein
MKNSATEGTDDLRQEGRKLAARLRKIGKMNLLLTLLVARLDGVGGRLGLGNIGTSPLLSLAVILAMRSCGVGLQCPSVHCEGGFPLAILLCTVLELRS